MKYLILFCLALGLKPISAAAKLILSQQEDTAPFVCEDLEVGTPDLLGHVFETKKVNLCHDKSFSEVVSKNCQTECALLRRAKVSDGKLKYNQRGTPGSWACRKLKAESGTYLVKKNETEYKVSFCHQDQDWMSTLSLLKNLGTSKK